ncbi:hypothetical protein DLJ53_09280 [Acuticoccus sediminis]|uniref:Dolichyl-phosphate-mannose-protein mannosyltransferase n=1 Tax=Acuticoccus sediminis TaxID=2184697 RepID=A0A8B2NVQ7_9HYPH|nr:hypothetical protein [Acuticoccus sediminis]RAI01604.1 hypothetical protein DLJ53_09280 [Acuticoccus sediminis]
MLDFVAVGVAALCLLAPAAWNGAPFPNSDTLSYLRVGDAAAHAMLDKLGFADAGAWLPRAPDVEPDGSADASATSASDEAIRMGTTYLGARSIYYGLPAYLLMVLGGFWAVAVAQAVLAAVTLRVVLSAMVPYIAPGATVALAALLTLTTPLGFLVSNIMPDVFLGLAAVSAAVLMAWFDRLGRSGVVFLCLMLAAGVLVHSTHAPILAAGVLAGAVVGSLRGLAFWRRGTVMSLVVIVAGLAAVLGAKKAEEIALGQPLRNPPFLMARVVADGPGRAWLDAACQERDLALCAFRDRPLDDSQAILWGTDPASAVFWPADYATRVRVIDEEREVVLGTLLSDPLGVASATATNVLRLTGRTALAAELDWNMPPEIWRDFDDYAPGTADAYAASAAYRDAIPFALVDGWFAAVGIAALGAALALLVYSARSASGIGAAAMIAGSVIIAVVAANIVLCGAASGPFDRYGARGLWLVPLVALAFLYGLRRTVGTATRGATPAPTERAVPPGAGSPQFGSKLEELT